MIVDPMENVLLMVQDVPAVIVMGAIQEKIVVMVSHFAKVTKPFYFDRTKFYHSGPVHNICYFVIP